MPELNHPPVVWRGFELTQRSRTSLTVCLECSELTVLYMWLTVTYKGGKPYTYKAELACHGVDVDKFGKPGESAEQVLEYCFLAIEQAYHALLKDKQDETVREQT